MTSPSTLGIYVQVPFCQTKCTYCNFHTGPVSRELYDPFAAAVRREIEMIRQPAPPGVLSSALHVLQPGPPQPAPGLPAESRAAWLDLPVSTVYVGGGTPSLLEPAALAQVMDSIRTRFSGDWQEATLEADPETITLPKAHAWRDAGFNRISLGVQSFSDEELRAAGRMHRRDDVFVAFRLLRAAGFANLSADLIAGLPHQTDSSWSDSLEQLLLLGPEHVSIYMMEIDEGSRLGREVLHGGERYSAGALPDDDSMVRFYEAACERLESAGYDHYEISNWGLPGHYSQHNLKYWQRAPYLGLGAGAHSFDGHSRWANEHRPDAYVAAIQQGRRPVEQYEVVSWQQALEEELFLGLRLLDGIDLSALEGRYNLSLRERFAPLIANGLIAARGTRVRLAPGRIAVSNLVFTELLA